MKKEANISEAMLGTRYYYLVFAGAPAQGNPYNSPMRWVSFLTSKSKEMGSKKTSIYQVFCLYKRLKWRQDL